MVPAFTNKQKTQLETDAFNVIRKMTRVVPRMLGSTEGH